MYVVGGREREGGIGGLWYGDLGLCVVNGGTERSTWKDCTVGGCDSVVEGLWSVVVVRRGTTGDSGGGGAGGGDSTGCLGEGMWPWQSVLGGGVCRMGWRGVLVKSIAGGALWWR